MTPQPSILELNKSLIFNIIGFPFILYVIGSYESGEMIVAELQSPINVILNGSL